MLTQDMNISRRLSMVYNSADRLRTVPDMHID